MLSSLSSRKSAAYFAGKQNVSPCVAMFSFPLSNNQLVIEVTTLAKVLNEEEGIANSAVYTA